MNNFKGSILITLIKLITIKLCTILLSNKIVRLLLILHLNGMEQLLKGLKEEKEYSQLKISSEMVFNLFYLRNDHASTNNTDWKATLC